MRYEVYGEVIMAASTEVEADSPEDALEQARAVRFSDIDVWDTDYLWSHATVIEE
jgi:hypothetical protein